MPQPFNIRPANNSDTKAILTLLSELGYQQTSDTLAKQLTYYQQPNSILLVAENHKNKDIIGLVSGHRIPLLHQHGFLGRITAMVVSERARSCGIGKNLVLEIEQWFENNDCVRYEVTSGEHRMNAHAFYEKLGYKSDERRFIKFPQ